MQGSISQAIALTIWGNAALREPPSFDEGDFYSSNRTFAFCEYVQFVDLRKTETTLEEVPYASDPVAWFRRIKDEGAYTLRLLYEPSSGEDVGNQKVPDSLLVAFVGGGGDWIIEAVKPAGSDYWAARWELGDRHREDSKIWRVTYGRVVADGPSAQAEAGASAEEIRQQLMAHLPEMAEFARAHYEERFARAFDVALACLVSPYPIEAPGRLAPKNVLPEIGAQLLDAVQAAWVFGGMGSWNDLAFGGEAQVQYEALSAELYRLLNTAIMAAANSSSRP